MRSGKFSKKEARIVALSMAISILRMEIDTPSELTANLNNNQMSVLNEVEQIVTLLGNKLDAAQIAVGQRVEDIAPGSF